MRTIFPVILFASLSLMPVFAQKSAAQNISAAAPFSVSSVIPPHQQTGNNNYLAAISGQDLKNGKYVFYTDSNASVAYIGINGTVLRMTGGENGEHIMAYTAKGYTVTLSVTKKSAAPGQSDADDRSTMNITGTLTIYNSKGQEVSKNISGKMTSAVKN